MSENQLEPQGRISIQLDKESYILALAGNTIVVVTLHLSWGSSSDSGRSRGGQ